MKPSSKQALLILGFSVFAFLNLFYKPLGLPPWSQGVFIFLGLICAVTLLVVQRRAKMRREPLTAPAKPPPDRQTRFLLIVIFFSCVLWTFLLPETGIHMLLWQRALCSAFAFVFLAGLVVFVRRRRGKA